MRLNYSGFNRLCKRWVSKDVHGSISLDWPALWKPSESVTTARDVPIGSSEPDDASLVDRFNAGERRAFDELVRRHQRGMWHLARRYTRNDADAADVVQLAFVRAFRSFDGFRGTASVRSWLYRVTINASLNYIRDHRREIAGGAAEELEQVGGNELSADATGAARIIDDEDQTKLRAAVEHLPAKQRLVLELRVFDELSFREVGELAGCSENAAKVNFHFAVKRLRELMSDDGGTTPSKGG